MAQHQSDVARSESAKRELHDAARRFFAESFTSEFEAEVVRPLAFGRGLLPHIEGPVAFDQSVSPPRFLPSTQLSLVEQDDSADAYHWLGPAAEETGGRLVVRASFPESVFPADGPTHKYAALFDSRPCFDGLRMAFMIGGDANSSVERFHSLLVEILANAKVVYDVAAAFALVEKCEAMMRVPQTIHAPPSFASRAWPAYLHALESAEYWFSVDEMLFMAEAARVHLIVLWYRGGRFQYYTSSPPVAGRRVCITLEHTGDDVVRSHFERVFKVEESLAGRADAVSDLRFRTGVPAAAVEPLPTPGGPLPSAAAGSHKASGSNSCVGDGTRSTNTGVAVASLGADAVSDRRRGAEVPGDALEHRPQEV